MADVLKLSVPAKPEYVGTVRIAAAHVASVAGFDVEAVDDIRVAVSEACTNIICHSGDGEDSGEEDCYDVQLALEEGKLTIRVEDHGKGYDLAEYEEPVPGEIRESGLGLFIIRALMDDVDIRSAIGAGTHICMTKLLQTQDV
jgi:serine/threonine-protein kinase RsbW